MLCHPFTLGRGFDHHPSVWASPEECGQSITRRPNPLIDHVTALRQNAHLTLFLVQVDGTILHGWSPLLRLRARLRSVERKLPPTREASRFIVSVSHTPPTPWVNTAIYGNTPTHIDVAEVVDLKVCWCVLASVSTRGRSRFPSMLDRPLRHLSA